MATIGFVMLAIRKRVSSVIGVPAVSAVPEAANVRTPSRTSTASAPGAPYPRRAASSTAWTFVVGAPVGVVVGDGVAVPGSAGGAAVGDGAVDEPQAQAASDRITAKAATVLGGHGAWARG